MSKTDPAKLKMALAYEQQLAALRKELAEAKAAPPPPAPIPEATPEQLAPLHREIAHLNETITRVQRQRDTALTELETFRVTAASEQKSLQARLDAMYATSGRLERELDQLRASPDQFRELREDLGKTKTELAKQRQLAASPSVKQWRQVISERDSFKDQLANMTAARDALLSAANRRAQHQAECENCRTAEGMIGDCMRPKTATVVQLHGKKVG